MPDVSAYLNQIQGDIDQGQQTPVSMPPVPDVTSTPSSDQLVNAAKSRGDEYVPTPSEAQAMSSDLAAIAKKHSDNVSGYVSQINTDIASTPPGPPEPPSPPSVDNAQAFKNDALRPLALFGAALSTTGNTMGAMNGVPLDVTNQQPTFGQQLKANMKSLGVDKDASYSNPAYAAAGGAVGGLTGSLPFLPLAPAAAAAYGLLGGAMNGAVTQATGSPTLGAAASLVVPGGYAAGKLAKAGIGLMNREAPEAVTSLENAGIMPNSAIKRGIELQNQFDQRPMGQYQKTAQATADQYGPQSSPQQIGKQLLGKSQAFLETNQQQAADAFRGFEKKIPPSTPVQTTATQDLLTTPSDGPKAPPVFGEISAAIDNGNGHLSYDAVKKFRTLVGNQIQWDETQNGGQFNPQLKQLYGTLTQDMEGAISKAGGQPALDAFHDMNSAFHDTQQFIEDRIGKLTDAGLTPEAVYNNLAANPRNTASRLKDLLDRGIIDRDDLNMIAGQQMRQMGLNSDGLWDPTTFTRNLQKMQTSSPEAVHLLFMGSPQQRASFDALVRNSRILHDATNSQMAKANPESSLGRKILGKGIRVAAGAAGAHVLGGEEAIGAFIGSMLPESSGEAGNALYRLAREPWFMSVLRRPASSPEKGAAYLLAIAAMHPQSAADLRSVASALQAQDRH